MADERDLPPPPPLLSPDQGADLPPPASKEDKASVEAIKELTREVKKMSQAEEQRAREEKDRQEAAWKMREEENFAGLNIQQLETFFQPEDEKTLRALSSVEEFATFAGDVRDEILEKRHQGLMPPPEKIDDFYREMSREIEQKIVVTFSKLTRRVDQEKPNQPFEEIVRQGSLFGSIEIIRTQLLQRVQLLTENIERRSNPHSGDPLPNILRARYFKSFTEKKLGEKKIDIGEADQKTINVMQIMPIPKDRPATLAEFLHGLHTQIDNEYVSRAFMHNIDVIFLRGKGESGFWDQMRGFAQTLGSTDIDRLTSLPDSELFMSAFRLYTKYVEERFAFYDWVHQPNMFINDLKGTTSDIENKVYEDLKRLFHEEGQDEWRLRRALSFGVGLSKGVFLTEIETAAWADPNVRTDKDGKSTFVSYYTNDSAALETLNQLHYYLRWQQEGMLKGPVLHMPVEGYSRRLFGLWDHVKLWERMKSFKDSWKKGRSAYNDFKNKAEKTFFEILPNIGKVGSFITRGSWRMEAASEGWMEYDEETGTQLKVLESWQTVENIGYETLLHFVKHRITEDFILPTKKTATEALKRKGIVVYSEKNIEDELKFQIALRDYFFKYLNARYINFDNGTGGVKNNKDGKGLEREIEKTRDQLKEEWKKYPHKKKSKVSDKDVYERLLHKTLTGVIRNRIPTKFIRIERDRTSEKGIRAWDRVRNKLQWDSKQMDETMDHLMMVELRLRQSTSNEMSDHLINNPSLRGYDGINYAVTDANIRRILGNIQLDEDPVKNQEKIERAAQLFVKINSEILKDDDYINNFTRDIQNDEFPFALAAEELETRFLAFRAAGESILMRSMGDNAGIEQHFSDKLQGYMDLLHKTSIDPNHDLSKIMEALEEMKGTFERIHGPNASWELVHHLSGVTIAYFKKDTVSKNWLGRLSRFGKYNSIASEVAGTFRRVWEWENKDIDNFITELERHRLVPKGEQELNFEKIPEVEKRYLFGKIPMGYKVKYNPSNEFTGKKLRNDFGGTKWDVASELLNKYLPIFLLFILYTSLSKALKEEFGRDK